MPINVRQTQINLHNAGFYAGAIDNVAGKIFFAGLFGYTAGRRIDSVISSIGVEAATWLPQYGWMGSPARLAEFLGETCNETGGYVSFQENMCYSAKRLMQVWPSRFKTLASAQPFAWDPSDPEREDVALANLVYGSRMGNEKNGTADDDGWDHRGGGMLQHTGAAEYEMLRARLGYTPDDVRDPAKSVRAACDYMQRVQTQAYIDKGDFKGARKSINGGYIGLDEVAAKRTRVLKVIV